MNNIPTAYRMGLMKKSIFLLLILAPCSFSQVGDTILVVQLSGFNQFVITDPLGNRVGNDISQGYLRYSEIPNAMLYLEGGSLDPDIPGDIKVFELEDQPTYGTYMVEVQAERLTWSELWMQPGNRYNFFPSAQDSLETTEYRVTFDPVTSDSLLVEKVVTHESAKRELAAMKKLGWIANDSLYQDLDSRFTQAENEVALGDTLAARTILEALDARVDSVEVQLGGNLGPRRERAAHLILKENIKVLLTALEP